ANDTTAARIRTAAAEPVRSEPEDCQIRGGGVVNPTARGVSGPGGFSVKGWNAGGERAPSAAARIAVTACRQLALQAKGHSDMGALMAPAFSSSPQQSMSVAAGIECICITV